MPQRRSSSRRKTGARKRRYSKGASSEVRKEMRHYKHGKHGIRVKSRKQAIAIGLSKARQKRKKVPRKSGR
jgi:hypothetical protein